jgi:hypothetical protein
MLALMKLTVYDWANYISAIIGISLFVFGAVRWFHRAMARSIATQFDEIRREVTPNGKDTPSLGDTAARTEAKLDQVIETLAHLDEELDEVKDKLIRHLGWHEGIKENGDHY